MINRKKIKPAKSVKPTKFDLTANNYVLVGNWIIDVHTLEVNMFISAVNSKTNMQFSTYCSEGLAVLYKHSPQELEHRLNVIGGLVSTVLLTENLSGLLKMFAPVMDGAPVTDGVVMDLAGTEEESQAIISEMKREHILGKIAESSDDELENMIESGEVNIDELTKEL